MEAAELVRTARSRAGLSQRQLAHRAGTAQSVVARIESGRVEPSLETLRRLLAPAGFELRSELVPLIADAADLLDDVPRILAMSPEGRLREVRNLSRFQAAARRRA